MPNKKWCFELAAETISVNAASPAIQRFIHACEYDECVAKFVGCVCALCVRLPCVCECVHCVCVLVVCVRAPCVFVVLCVCVCVVFACAWLLVYVRGLCMGACFVYGCVL